MESKLAKELHCLRIYVIAGALVAAVLVFTAFAQQRGKQRFDEIDVERINLVEKDGRVKLAIANKERLPGPGNIVTTKVTPRQGLKGAGILFYNEKGDESGGFSWLSAEDAHSYGAASLLAFDKYNGDQLLALQYEEKDGRRKAGLNVWEQPDASPAEQRRNYEQAHKLQPGPERDRLMQQAVAYPRVFVGRLANRSAEVTLCDANGRPRLRLSVAPDGDPKLEFLDATGKVTQTLPEK
jgi:hypothetical protein